MGILKTKPTIRLQRPEAVESVAITTHQDFTTGTEKAVIMSQIGTMQLGEAVICGAVIFNSGTSTRNVIHGIEKDVNIPLEGLRYFEFFQGGKRHFVHVNPVMNNGNEPPEGWHVFSETDDAGKVVFCWMRVNGNVIDKIGISLTGNGSLASEMVWKINFLKGVA